MAIAWADVLKVAPELSAVAVEAQTVILGYVNATLNTDLGDRYTLAGSYYAAHFGKLVADGASASPGPVTSESMGGISRSYAITAVAGGSADLGATAYGRAFLTLARGAVCARGLVT